MSRMDLRKSFRLLLRPAMFACLFLAVWNAVRIGFPNHVEIEPQWAAAIIGGTYGLHALFAGFSINRISNKQDTIEEADAKGDMDDFMFHRDRRSLDAPWRILLLTQTIILHSMFLIAPFHEFSLGMVFILGGSLSVFIFWEVAVELDDPFSGIWNLQLHHPEWRCVDVAEHFRSKVGKHHDGQHEHPQVESIDAISG